MTKPLSSNALGEPIARFSAAAATYDRHAALHRRIAKQLLEWAEPLGEGERVLDAGCGTGILTQLLVRHYPHATIDALDLSPTMLAAAQSNLAHYPWINWINVDVGTYQAPTPYRCIASSATLQWLPPAADIIAQLGQQLTDGGHLLLSVMTEQTLHELHAVRQLVAPTKVPAMRLEPHDAYVDALLTTPFTLIRSDVQTYTTYYPHARDLLRALHEQGVTGGRVSRGTHPLTRRELADLATLYDQRFREPDGRVCATYEVGFYLARKEGSSA